MVMKKNNEQSSSLFDRHANKKPVFKTPISDVRVKLKSNVKFIAKVYGVPAPKIIWLFNNERIENGKNYRCVNKGKRHTLIINCVTQDDQGNFTCCATNLAGSAKSSAVLTISPAKEVNKPNKKNSLAKSSEFDRFESRKDEVQKGLYSSVTPTNQSEKSFLDEQENYVEYSSPTTVSQSELESFSEDFANDHRHRTRHKIKRIRVGKKHSTNIGNFSEDWTDEVRKLIREELENKEKEKEVLEASLKNGKSEANLVSSYPPNFVQTIVDCNVMTGETAHFVYILAAEPQAEVLWLRNGMPMFLHDNSRSDSEARTASDGNVGFISDSNAGCLVISEADSSYIGVYTCVASNQFGSSKCSANLKLLPSHEDHSSKDIGSFQVHENSSAAQFIDQDTQTYESRVDDEDRLITDAFKQLETAEKMQQIPDFIIDDSVPQNIGVPKHDEGISYQHWKRKRSRLKKHGRMDDNETGEGLEYALTTLMVAQLTKPASNSLQACRYDRQGYDYGAKHF